MTFTPKFDYYSATLFGCKIERILDEITRFRPTLSTRQCNAQKGYERAVGLYASETAEVPQVRLSTGQLEMGVNYETKSHSQEYVHIVKGFQHQVSRVDSCIDVVDPFFFEWANEELVAIAKKRNIHLDMQGDWERGKARTRYLGGRGSVIQICLYEKGQKEKADPDWIRLEVRLRPNKKHHKQQISKLSSHEVFTYAPWMKEFYKKIGIKYEEQTREKVWRPEDSEIAAYHLCKQYKNVIRHMLKNNQNDWFQVGTKIESAIEGIESGEMPDKTIKTLSGKGEREVEGT